MLFKTVSCMEKNTFIATITGKNWWKDIVFIYILRNKLRETEQCNYDLIFEKKQISSTKAGWPRTIWYLKTNNPSKFYRLTLIKPKVHRQPNIRFFVYKRLRLVRPYLTNQAFNLNWKVNAPIMGFCFKFTQLARLQNLNQVTNGCTSWIFFSYLC